MLSSNLTPEDWISAPAAKADAPAPDAQAAQAPQLPDQSDALFNALLQRESGGNQFDKTGAPITSKKGAIGIAQVMPGTAPEAAKLAGLDFDDLRYRTDAEYNKALGRAYLGKQLEDFGGDPAKALAAYNAGPEAVRRAIKASEAAADGSSWLSRLPRETQAYVPTILKRSGNLPGQTAPQTPQEYYTPQQSSLATFEPDNRSFFEKVAGGFEKGARQSASLGASALALINRTTTDEEGNDFQKSMLQFAKEQDQAAAKASRNAPQFSDVVSGDGSFSNWLADSVGYLGYQVGEAVLTGGAGALIGRSVGKELVRDVATNAVAREAARIAATDAGKQLTKDQIGDMAAKRVAAELTGAASVFANNIRQEGGSIYSDALKHREEDGTPVDLSKVWLASLAAAGVDTMADAAAARGLLGRGGSSAGNYLARAATQVPRQMAIQGGTEFGQNLIEAAGAGRDPFTKKQLISALDDAAVGALGGVLPGAGAAMNRVEHSPLTNAANAGTQSKPATPEPPKVDPVARLAELEAIGRGTEEQVITGPEGNQITIPGEPGRFFTPEEKAEYDQLKNLRDATPGMTPDEKKAAEDAEQEKQPDLILERARGIEQMLRTNEGLSALRSENSPVSVQTFLSDLAKAKSPSTPASAREQSLSRLETTAEWLGFDLAALPNAETVQNTPADVAPADTEAGRSRSPEAQAWMDKQPPEQPTVPTETTVKAQEVSQMLRESQLSDEDRTAATEALTTYRNRNLPERTRQQALNMALEIVGRTQAPQGKPSENQTPAVLGEIEPQADTPEYFLREAERRENGAWEFRQLGFNDEANSLVAEADSLREKAASARAGELGMEDSAEADADTVSPPQQQTLDQATNGLPRTQIPAETDADTGEAGTALRRKRKGQLQQLAANGFDTVERRDNGFVLINTKNQQEVLLDSPADAQMARAAIKEHVDSKAHTAAASPMNDRLEPTQAQIDAGNYKKSDVIDLNGVKVKIENPAGSVRRGTSPDGTQWETQMAHHYGEIMGVEGADGDKIDVFIGNRPDSNRVFVVDQVNPDGTFDEHKLVFGATSEEDARQTYLANYEKGWTGLGAITEIPVGSLKQWLKTGAKKPAAESDFAPIQVKVDGQTLNVTPVPVDALPASAAESTARGKSGPAINKRQAVILKGIAGVFGKDVVFYDDPENKTKSDGFVRDGDSSRIYINVRSGMSPLAVLGHELMHILKAENPQAYAAIAKVVQSRVKDAKGFRSYYNQTKPDQTAEGDLNEGELEELISDLNGNLMSDATFWKEVFDEIGASNPDNAKGIIAQLASFVQKIIDAAVKAFSGSTQFKSDQYVNDLSAVREAFRKGLAQYAQGQGITKQAMQAEILRAGNGTDVKRSATKPSDGLTVEGYHFSKQPRQILSTGFYGSGLRGSDRDEIMSYPDKRLRERLSFYVDKGTGVRPEEGVGAIAHKATLRNIYDADADPRRLRQGRNRRGFEMAVLNAGYSGYLNRMDGTQPGQVILLGQQTVTPEVLGLRSKVEDATKVPEPVQREMDLGDKIMAAKGLPGGALAPSSWLKVLMDKMPAEAAEVMAAGDLGNQPLYRDELVAKVRSMKGEIKRSTQRARDEYADVEAKYKGTDQWMVSPNGSPTKLTERQWVQVRTPAFKKWFGDWEAAHKAGGVWSVEPGSVSTAVGDDGEPLVLYHGTSKGGFMQFEEPTGSKRGDLGIFMTDDYGMAGSYVRKNRIKDVVDPEVGEQTGWRYISNKDGQPIFNMSLGDDAETRAAREKTYDAKAVPLYGEVAQAGDQPGVYALFANIRNPNESHFEGANWDGSRDGQYQVRNEDGEPIYDADGRAYFDDRDDALALAMQNEGAIVEPAEEHHESTDLVVKDAWRYKHDGAIIRQVMDDGGGGGRYSYEPADVFVALNANQVKSADFNGGEFDSKQSDIRRSQRRNDFDDPRDRIEVSTTVPSAKVKGKVVNDAVNEKWVIDAEDVKATKDHQKAAIAAFKMYNAATVTDSKKALQQVHDVIVDNLVWLFKKMPDNIRARAKLWYDGANRIANQVAEKYGLDPRQSAGVFAVLSPQKDWFMNVSLGERLIKIHQEHGNEPWSEAMTNWVRSYVAASKDVGTKGKRQALLNDALRLEGKTLAEMNDRDAARFIRVFDETYHPRSYRVVTPEGGFGDYVTKGDDEVVNPDDEDADLVEPGMVAWGSYPTIEKGVSILRNGDRDNLFRNLSEALGDEHKVRNFYNNIIAPGSADGHVTIDTHAVAAAFIKALSGNSLEVMHNFGTTPKGAPGAGGNAATGASGLYGVFADAYRDAAYKVGVLPREMQSITWEAIRSIFQPTFKSTRAGDVEKIFNRYKAGEITREEARAEAYQIAGGIKAMPWEGTPEGRYFAEGGRSFDGDIAREPENRKARVLDAEDTKDKVTINLSAATSTIPGIAELGKAANKGDVLAQQLIQDIALDNLQYLLSGTSASVKADRVTGLYFNEIEPSLGLTVTFSENDESAVLAAIAKFADNFNQQAVHVRRMLPSKVKPLTEYPDGSFATSVYQWKLKKALARKRIQSIIDQSGLAGLSFTDEYVEAYFVGDPKDESKSIKQQSEEFFKQIAVADRLLSGAGGKVSSGRARLWSYGDGYGTRIGYAAIRGDIPGRNAVSNKTAKRVAGYLNATQDKDGNPVLGRIKTFDQPDSITPRQEALQREIAEAYDALPENDLKNPRVRKAYAELSREVLRQYKALPVKVEVLAGQGEPYKNSDAMRRDVLDNNHLFIFGTEPGAFGPPGQDFSSHPLLADTGLKDPNNHPLLFNDLLRAVHDYYAHSMTPAQFGPRGEEAAWKNHMSMTSSPWARWALTMETRAQNSWVNFRPDLDRGTPSKDRPFATQKAALLPVQYTLTGDRNIDRVMKEFIEDLPEAQRIGSKPDAKRSTQRYDDDNLVINFGDEDAAAPSETLADEIKAEQAKGRKVTYDVEVEDTGETAKMTVDGGEALADYDQRIDTMTKLLECLRK